MSTKQKRTEHILEQLEWARTIFENATIGVAIATPDGRFFQVNPAFCRFLGYTEEELLELTIADVTHPHDQKESLRLLHEVRERGKPGEQIEMRKRYIRKDRLATSQVTRNLALVHLQPLLTVGLSEKPIP